MGAWGPGLYSDDFALDLRSAVSSVSRLPKDGGEIVELLIELHPAAVDQDDEDHGTFWLVVADQLHRRGISSPATDRAVEIIEDESNLAMLAALGLPGSDLRKRRANLTKLRLKLIEPPPEKKRRILKSPQPLLLEPGQVFAYPIDSQGNCYNPYFTDKDAAIRPFHQAGWGSCQVLGTGHALGYFAWYQIAADPKPGKRRPGLEQALNKIDPNYQGIGTLPRIHLKRMNLELLGVKEPPKTEPPTQQKTIRVTASDISVSNVLSPFWPRGSI